MKDDDSVALYGIPDASLNTELSTIPCVQGLPYLKSFWGTPIVTGRGYKIGILWILDDKPRPQLGNNQVRFIRQVALCKEGCVHFRH